MSAELAQKIAPPHDKVIDLFKKVAPPPFVTPKGILPIKDVDLPHNFRPEGKPGIKDVPVPEIPSDKLDVPGRPFPMPPKPARPAGGMKLPPKPEVTKPQVIEPTYPDRPQYVPLQDINPSYPDRPQYIPPQDTKPTYPDRPQTRPPRPQYTPPNPTRPEIKTYPSPDNKLYVPSRGSNQQRGKTGE